MNFTEAIANGFHNYGNSSGRAARSEYWYWSLFAVGVAIVGAVIDILAFPLWDIGPVGLVLGLATLLPDVAVSIRRLHDIDRSGWWVLITLTIIGIIPMVIWACTKGTTGPNRFGDDPLAGNAPAGLPRAQ